MFDGRLEVCVWWALAGYTVRCATPLQLVRPTGSTTDARDLSLKRPQNGLIDMEYRTALYSTYAPPYTHACHNRTPTAHRRRSTGGAACTYIHVVHTLHA